MEYKTIYLKDFTADFINEKILEAMKEGKLKNQIQENLETWLKDYQPGNVFRLNIQVKLQPIQVLPNEPGLYEIKN